MIASLVREGRMEKGYTQKELSELSNISVRSIQRIENGEIIPRTYTLKRLAGILGRSYEDFARNMQEQGTGETVVENLPANSPVRISHAQRVILSAGICLSILVLAAAFIAQSPRFPETSFEFFVFSAVVLLLITVTLFFLWRRK